VLPNSTHADSNKKELL